MSARYTSTADRVGIMSAIICTVHCLVVPVLFLAKYWWSNTVGKAMWRDGLPTWWEKFDYLFLVIGFAAVYHAAAHAAGNKIKASLWFFWGCLALAVIFESTLHWMAYVASIGLIATHFVNIKRHRKAAMSNALS